jgi:broad specificity phosphatase PhoE
MSKLYIVRHGETTYNVEGRIQGQSDAPLTPLGLRQASAVAERLAPERFTAIYSSDLGRAVTTAQIIGERLAVGVTRTPLLRELHFGVIQGLTRDEIEQQYPESEHEWRRRKDTMRPPGAESWEQMVRRCRQFLDEIDRIYNPDQQVLVVAHGGSLRGLIIAALNLPLGFRRQVHTQNASLSIIETGPNPALWLLNDVCHLDSLRTSGDEPDATVA